MISRCLFLFFFASIDMFKVTSDKKAPLYHIKRKLFFVSLLWAPHLYIDNKFSTFIFYIICEEEISKIRDGVMKNVQFDQKQEKTFLDLEN